MSEWTLTYEGFEPDQEGLREALCTLGNGYFATRGAAPESVADDVHYPGTYVAGLFNRLESEVSGRVVENEDLVNVPNWLTLLLRMAGSQDWVDLRHAALNEYRQELDVRKGVLTRLFVITDHEGRRTRVAQRRFVHMRDPHLAGLETTFLAENWSGLLEVRSALDGTVINGGVARYRQLNSQHLAHVETGSMGEDVVYLEVETSQSRVSVAEAARTRVFSNDVPVTVERSFHEQPGWVAQELGLQLRESEPLTVEKLVALYTSRDHAIAEAGLEARNRVRRAGSFAEELEQHILGWDHLWRRFHLESSAEPPTSLILNLHIFHLLQTVSKHTIDLDVGVPARGLHGEAYRGHIFWDEVFIYPFLNLHLPDLTQSLLQYRYRRLSEARRAAREEGLEGALFPWQSGSNGREESQVVHLNPRSGRWVPDNSRLQRHINVSVAYNVWQYFETTGDLEFLAFYGAEMLVEIARLWSSLAYYNRAIDRYEIRTVMGPDEYHDSYPDSGEPGLNNNAYTNVMAVWGMLRAMDALEAVPDYRRRELWEKLGLRLEELERWDDMTRKMLVPFHGDRIISQFEGFEDLAEFDWEDYRRKYGDIQRLDRILEAEDDSANRYKACKQADVLMLFYLLSEEELAGLFERLGYEWDPAIFTRNVEYYMNRTAHGSTLSRVVHSWVLARSDRTRSWEFFSDALRSDVADIQGGTTPEGIHLGAMAGTVDLVQRGFTGIEARGDCLRLNPAIPPELGGLRFDIVYRGQWISFDISADLLVASAHHGPGEALRIKVRDEMLELAPGAKAEVVLS